jgi:hypothetical protein
MKVDQEDCSLKNEICTSNGCGACTTDGECGQVIAGTCTKNACVSGLCAVVDRLQGGDCAGGGTCNATGVCQLRRYVFVTSTTVPPTFGTATHADLQCHNAATALGGTWKAWVSDTTTSPSQWAASTSTSSLPYYLLDDTTEVAKSWTALTTMSLDKPINKDEHGNPVMTGLVWTGTHSNGTPTGVNCGNWLVATAQASGTMGSVGATDLWSELAMSQPCTSTAHLYCFQQ